LRIAHTVVQTYLLNIPGLVAGIGIPATLWQQVSGIPIPDTGEFSRISEKIRGAFVKTAVFVFVFQYCSSLTFLHLLHHLNKTLDRYYVLLYRCNSGFVAMKDIANVPHCQYPALPLRQSRMAKDDLLDNYAGVQEVSQRLNIHPESVRRLIRQGKLPAIKFGNKWLVEKSTLEQYASRYDPRPGNKATLL
jgi:excisionase family DNA binding protein